MRHAYYIVDVFAEERYAGNQLAVICDAADIDDATMQAIARETTYSETTFILGDQSRDGGYDVRIFTPTMELPFAGHPTLGTAYVINHLLRESPEKQISINLKVGPIPVTFADDGVLWMRQNQPTFGAVVPPEKAAAAISLPVGLLDVDFPVQVVSTGLKTVVVPVRDLAAVQAGTVNLDACAELERLADNAGGTTLLMLVTRETVYAENDLHARVWAYDGGAFEDAATGSANGCLAAWLVAHRFFGDGGVDCRVEQGYEMARPSLLMLRASETDGVYSIEVGGRVVPTMRGELLDQ